MRFVRVTALLVGAALGGSLSAPVFADPSIVELLFPSAPRGDFNGDGIPDALLQPSTSAQDVRTVTADDNGPNTRNLQSFPANYLGLGWSMPDSVAHLGDFDADGRTDVYLQPRTRAGEHSIVLANEKGVLAQEAERFRSSYLGLQWAADESNAIVGDFDGDSHSDVLLQPVGWGGDAAVVLADNTGSFAIGAQVWQDGYLGRTWNGSEVRLYTADFDGDSRSDLLVQVLDDKTLLGPPQQAAFALLLAGSNGTFTSIDQTWDREAFGSDWSDETHEIVLGDYDGDRRADVWLRARKSGGQSQLLLGGAGGRISAVSVRWYDGSTPIQALQRAQSVTAAPALDAVGEVLALESVYGGMGIESLTYQQEGTTTSGTRNSLSTYAVGATQSSFSVDNVGSAHYSIPINTPPGVQGIQPNLAIAYSSRAGNGLAGMGFGVSGLPTITRCNKTIAQDGANAPVSYTTSDKYCLNGQRLRLESGTYGGHNALYRTEIESFARVTSFTSGGNGTTPTGGPKYFTVETGDGLIYEYGNSDDSRIEAQGRTVVRVWALKRVIDRFGNYMDYEYTEDNTNGDYRPSTIKWTGNGAQAPIYTLSFVYENRPSNDTVIGYVAGSVEKSLKRLLRLEIIYNSSVVRKYDLTYDTSGESATPRSRLLRIQECASSSCLPPHTMTWQNGAKGLNSPVSSISVTNANAYANARTMDVNGDGRADLVYPDGASNGKWQVALGKADGTFDTAVNTNQPYYTTYYEYAIAVDIDADGDDDLMAPNATIWQVWKWDASNNTFSSPISTALPSNTTTRTNGFLADTDGDGRADFVYAATNSTSLKRRLGINNDFSTEDTVFTSSEWKFQAQAFGTNSSWMRSAIRVADVNGDGRADLLALMKDFLYCNGEPPGCQDPVFWEVFISSGSTYYEDGQVADATIQPILTDLNGDGLTDLAYNKSSTWRYIISSGSLGSEQNSGIAAQGTLAVSLDYDGDGKQDLLVLKSGSSNWWVLRSTGTGLEALVDTGIAQGSAALSVADTDGNGLSDLVHWASNNFKHVLHKGPLPDLAVGFTDSLENPWSVAYLPLASSAIHTKSSGATFPVFDYQGAMHVVGSYDSPDGLGSVYTTDLVYSGARIDRQGRGFLGFSSTLAVDGRTGIKTTKIFSQTYPKAGMVASVLVEQSGGTDIVTTTNTLDSTTLNSGSNQRYFVSVSDSASEYSEVGGTYNGVSFRKTAVTYTYDSYGNIDQQVLTYGTTASPSQFTTTIDPTLSNYTSTVWCLGRPSQIDVTNAISGGASLTRTTTITQNSSTCRVTDESVADDAGFGGPSLSLTKAYTYDSYGNVATVGVTGHDGTGSTTRTTTASYSGTNGYLPSSITNPANQATSISWNRSYAKPSSITNPNTLAASMTYDVFGRLTAQVGPDVTTQATTYSWFDEAAGNECQPTLLRIKILTQKKRTSDSGVNNQSYVVLDTFGRVKRSAVLLLGGKWSLSNRCYDDEGHVTQDEVPHYGGDTVYFVDRTYDLIGRLASETRPASETDLDGSATNYAYEKFVTKFTDPKNNVTERTSNAKGEITQVKDALTNSMSYAHDAFGNLTQTTDPSSNQISMSYDKYGNKRTMVDPDMGSWTYEYNAYGELTKQTDSKAQVTTFSYDGLGRMVSRTEPGTGGNCTATWTWDSATHGVGRLAGVAVNAYCDPFAESYTYDAYSRLAEATTTIESIAYVTTIGYDTFGRPSSLTYPASTNGVRFAVNYVYDTSGIMNSVSNAVSPYTTYWTNNAVNALGQVTQETAGNASNPVISNYDFDLATGRMDSIHSGPSASGTAIQNLSYIWDEAGNLTQRKEDTQSLTEHFCYDALHRLTLASLSAVTCGSTSPTIAYSALGNITTKDGTTYTYGGSRPHALTSTSGTISGSYSYDGNGNMTSKAGETLTWTSYNYLSSVSRSGNSSAFSYAPSRMRFKQVTLDHNSVTATTTYVGGVLEKYTKGGVTEYRHLVRAGGRAVAQYTRISTGTNEIRYLHRDHLGSVESITDDAGARMVQISFDAFGRRRSGTGWTALAWNDWTSIGTQNSVTSRGYGGHENLDEIGLVHMNGRVYDAFLGRVLSADPTIPDPRNLQAFNRYSYALNAPLTLIDPSGFSPLDSACGGSPSCHTAWDGSGGVDHNLSLPGQSPCDQSGCHNDGIVIRDAGDIVNVGQPLIGGGGTMGFEVEGGTEPAYVGENMTVHAPFVVPRRPDVGGSVGQVSSNVSDLAGQLAALNGATGGRPSGRYWPTGHPGVPPHSGFGSRTLAGITRDHQGWDFWADFLDSIYTTEDGIFLGEYTSSDGIGIAYVLMSDGTVAEYLHLNVAPGLAPGQFVPGGSYLGFSDASGVAPSYGNGTFSTNAHLHFGIISGPSWNASGNGYMDGVRVNPSSYFNVFLPPAPSVTCTGCN